MKTKSGFHVGLKILRLILVAAIILPLLLVAGLLLRPQIILNTWTLKTALQVLNGGSVWSKYDRAELHVSSDNLLRKKFFMHFNNLCVDMKSGLFKGCFDEISLNVKFQIQKPFLKLVEFGPTVINARQFSLDIKPTPPTPNAQPSRFLKYILPDDLGSLRVYPLDIQLEKMAMKQPGLLVTGRAKLTDNGSLSARGPWQLQFTFNGEEKNQNVSVSGDIRLASARQILTGPLTLDGHLEGRSPETPPFKIKISAGAFENPGAGATRGEDFKLRLSSRDACLKSKNGPVQGCLTDFDVGVRGRYGHEVLKMKTLAPFKVVSEKFFIDLDRLSGAGASTPNSGGASAAGPRRATQGVSGATGEFDFVKQGAALKFEDVKVQLPQIHLVSGGENIEAHLKIDSSGPGVNLKLNIEEIKAQLTAHAAFAIVPGDSSLLLTGPLGLKSGDLTVETRTQLQLSAEQLGFNVDALIESLPWQAHASVKGAFAEQNIKGTITHLAAHNAAFLLRGADDKPCVFDFALNRRSALGCAIGLKFKSAEMDKLIGAPNFEIKMDLSTEFPPSGDTPWTGFVALTLPPLKNEWLNAGGEVKVLFNKTSFNKELLKDLDIHTDLNLEISDFAAWVNKTYSTSFAVPAPINALKGNISLKSQGVFHGIYAKLPLQLTSTLRGQDQALVIDGHGSLGAVAQGSRYVPVLEAQVIFKEVQLMLPRLNLAAPPALLPDSRITNMKEVREAEKGATAVAPGFLYSVRLKTNEGAPIKLISNLAQGPIPVALDVTLKTVEGLRGKVGIEKFPVELFGHKAQIVRLNLQLLSMRLEENRIDGEASVAVNDYKIIINLSGSPRAPVVRFLSEPPLPQNQIVPVVLFGKTPESLDADQKNSSNNFQSALQDQALPLASFFFLASTPVESVGYDTQQKIFTAKVRIRNGLSLDVGSNGAQVNQLGLNKRLGKSWSIRTYVKNPTDQTQTQSVTAFLEKLFQY